MQFLGKENSQLQSQVKELLIELNRQKDENYQLTEKIAELQMDETHILVRLKEPRLIRPAYKLILLGSWRYETLEK